MIDLPGFLSGDALSNSQNEALIDNGFSDVLKAFLY